MDYKEEILKMQKAMFKLISIGEKEADINRDIHSYYKKLENRVSYLEDIVETLQYKMEKII